MKIAKYGRFWAVFDADGVLVCLTVYRKGAQEVVKRLTTQPHAHWCRYCRMPAVCTTATCTPTTEWICQACECWCTTPHSSQPGQGARLARRGAVGRAPPRPLGAPPRPTGHGLFPTLGALPAPTGVSCW